MVKIAINEIAFKLKSSRKVHKIELSGSQKVAFEGDKLFIRSFGELLFELNLAETEWILLGNELKIR